MPAVPDAVDVGPADDAAGGVAAGQGAPVLAVDRHAGQIERRQLARLTVVDLAGDVHEPAILGRHLRFQLVAPLGGEPEDPGEGVRRARRILDLVRVDGDRARRHGQGELVAVAVEDRAPLGGQDAVPGPLLGAPRCAASHPRRVCSSPTRTSTAPRIRSIATSVLISRRRGWPAENRVSPPRTSASAAFRRARWRGSGARRPSASAPGGRAQAAVPTAGGATRGVRRRQRSDLAVSRRDRSGTVRRPTAAPSRRGSSAGRRVLAGRGSPRGTRWC